MYLKYIHTTKIHYLKYKCTTIFFKNKYTFLNVAKYISIYSKMLQKESYFNVFLILFFKIHYKTICKYLCIFILQ